MAASVGMAALGSAASGYLGKRSADKAAAAQKSASKASIAEQRRQFDIIQKQAAPYRGVGQEAIYSLADMMGIGYGDPYAEEIASLEQQLAGATGGGGAFADVAKRVGGKQQTDLQKKLDYLRQQQAKLQGREKYDFTQSPGYQFRLEEGMKGLERSQAGRRLSGRAAKEAMRYGQEYGSGEFGAQFGRLSQLAGYGPSMVGAGMPTGIPGTMERSGAAQATTAMQGGQAINEAIQGGLGNYMTSQWMDYNK